MPGAHVGARHGPIPPNRGISMTENRIAARRTANRNKALALGAAGLVLAGGVTAGSLAAWTDVEWIAGGVGTTGGVAASSFEVEQFTASDTTWGHYEDEAGANVVDFSAAAASLTPGDTVYGYVRLRTETDSLGGELSLEALTDVVPGGLADALTYTAVLMDAASTCNATDFATATVSTLVAASAGLDAGGGAPFTLAAGTPTQPGAERTVCFAITFPATYANDETLQGATAAPVWRFDAISVAP